MPLATKEEQKEYQRKWVARRRAEYFSDKVCVVCQTSENLQLDHKDPKQKVSHCIWSWRKDRRDVELAKCQILCATHHLEKTLGQDRRRAVISPVSSTLTPAAKNLMRDKDRIPKILKEIEELWMKYPDLRLGQIIANAADVNENQHLFYVEDERLLSKIRKLLSK